MAPLASTATAAGLPIRFACGSLCRDQAWAVGYTCTGFRILIVHWNGMAWSRQPSPTPGPVSQLFGVAVTSTRNAWAAGAHENGSILQHWNGTTWR
jgi:hypothetical protein